MYGAIVRSLYSCKADMCTLYWPLDWGAGQANEEETFY